jgi:hypothetical protein
MCKNISIYLNEEHIKITVSCYALTLMEGRKERSVKEITFKSNSVLRKMYERFPGILRPHTPKIIK